MYNVLLAIIKIKMINFQWNISATSQADVSINFNIGEISYILRESTFEEWRHYETFDSDYIYNRTINYRIPLSMATITKHNIYCDFDCKNHHRMRIQ